MHQARAPELAFLGKGVRQIPIHPDPDAIDEATKRVWFQLWQRDVSAMDWTGLLASSKSLAVHSLEEVGCSGMKADRQGLEGWSTNELNGLQLFGNSPSCSDSVRHPVSGRPVNWFPLRF